MGDNAEIGIFSEEERNEIAARIEAASCREAAAPPRLPARGGTARKGLFPLGVNLGGALLLGAGLFCLFAFQQKGTAEIRESGEILGITERRLIQEIRREVNLRISEKEAAIEVMNRRIAEVDAELLRLDSLEALTDEQRSAMTGLRQQQEEYRTSLGRLQAERARIIAEAVQREAALYARLEKQQGELENLSARSRAEIDAAREELSRLFGEQEKAALVEKQLSAFYSGVSAHIQAGRYKDAYQSLAALREYLSTPSFQSLKRIQARRESDLVAVNALSVMIAEALKSPVAESSPPAPDGEDAALKQQLALERSAAAEQGAALASREQTLAELQKNLGDLQKSFSELQTKNADAQKTIADRDRQLESLRTQNTAYAQTIDRQQKTIAALSAELENR